MDDFFRIPKSLCYFMVKHPPLDKSPATVQSTKKKSENDAKRRGRVKNRSPIEKSNKKPEVRKERASDDPPSADETSVKKKIVDSDKLEKNEEPQTTASPIDCSSLVEATLDPPPKKKRKRKNSPKPKNVKKKKPSPRSEKSKKNVTPPTESSSKDADDGDLDDVSLDQRETTTKKRRKKSSKPRAPVSFECETCGRSFPRKSALKVHMVNHSTVKTHKCDICEKLFKRKSALTTHMPLHTGEKFSCDECDYTTTSKIAVRYHVRRMHRKDFRYKCDECGKSFMSNSEVKDHKTSHLGTKSFICEFCGKGYLQKSSLTAHKRSVHGVVLKVFKREHQCKICNKFFASEYLLHNHVGIHSRKFLCTHCGKEFATNHGLLLHNRMHTGERPFQCRYCSKSFVRSNALAVHRLTHTGERPYVCDLCGKSFTQRTTMMAHRKKHPGSHPPPPPTQLSKLDAAVVPNS